MRHNFKTSYNKDKFNLLKEELKDMVLSMLYTTNVSTNDIIVGLFFFYHTQKKKNHIAQSLI